MVNFRTDKEVLQIMGNCVDFVCELIDYIAEYPDDDYMTMECLCRKLVKYDLIDKKDGYYLVADGINADRKTENCSEKPNNSKVSEIPTGSEKPNNCDTCKWGEWYRQGYDITMMDDECGGCCSWNSKWTPKDEPQTETVQGTGDCEHCSRLFIDCDGR